MAPEQMLDLARRAAELLVERIAELPGDNAWDDGDRTAAGAPAKLGAAEEQA